MGPKLRRRTCDGRAAEGRDGVAAVHGGGRAGARAEAPAAEKQDELPGEDEEEEEEEEEGRGAGRREERDWRRREERRDDHRRVEDRRGGARREEDRGEERREEDRGDERRGDERRGGGRSRWRSPSRGSSAWSEGRRNVRIRSDERRADERRGGDERRADERRADERRGGDEPRGGGGYGGGGYRDEGPRDGGYRGYRDEGYRGGRYGDRSPRQDDGGDLRSRLGSRQEEFRERDRLRREVLEMKAKMSAIETKNKINNSAPMLKRNHTEQMKFCVDVKGSFEEARAEVSKLFPQGVPGYSDLEGAINRGEAKVDFRCKLIAIADTSHLGWYTANEYAGSAFALSDADARKIEEAEKRAQKKLDRFKKEEEVRRRGSGGGGGGSTDPRSTRRKSRSRERSPKKRSKSRSKPRDTRECYYCKKVGHLSYNCPEKKQKKKT